MKVLSQDKEVVIDYAVHKGDWAIDEEKSPPWGGPEPAVPSSTEIDERTCKAYLFDTLEEAEAKAKQILEDRKDDPWLAYVEIKECHLTVIKKLK